MEIPKRRPPRTKGDKINQNESNPLLDGLSRQERKIYLEFKVAEKYLGNFITEKNFKDVIEEKSKLLKAIQSLNYTSFKLLKTNISAYTKLNIDQRMWKVSVHDIVDLGRHASATNSLLKADIKSSVQEFLEIGIQYLEELVQWIEFEYPYSRNLYNGKAEYKSKTPGDTEYVTCLLPRILISLGDSLRYSAPTNQDGLKRAAEAFEKVRRIDPTNGRAYHQMGVVALIRKDVLGAIYNFTRAYSCPSPVEPAKQQLYIVFDEAYKMYQTVWPLYWYNVGKRTEVMNPNAVKKQIWIFNQTFQEEVPNPPDEPQTKEEHVNQLSSSELCRRFYITFVQVLGKLFTGIGLENLNTVAEEALVYFQGILNRKHGFNNIFPPLRLIQVLTMNMHVIHHLRPKTKTDTIWTTAIQFVMEIFFIITERLNKLLDLCDWDNPDLEILSMGLHIWTDWMRMNPKDWSRRRPRPVFSIHHVQNPKTEIMKNREDEVWVSFACLMSRLDVILQRFQATLFPSISRNEDEKHAYCLSPFIESKHLFGYSIFENAQMFDRVYYCDDNKKVTRGRNFIRMRSIHKIGLQIICSKYSILEYKISNGVREFFSQMTVKKPLADTEVGGLDKSQYQFWLNQFSQNEKKKQNSKTKKPDDSSEVIAVSKNPLDEGESHTHDLVMSHTHTVSREYKLWLYLADQGFMTEMIVLPNRYVLDTNCFVRRLELVKILLTLVTEPLYIPVAVVLELKGLARGGLRPKDRIRFETEDSKLEVQEKIIDGMELAESCKLGLGFIAENFDYFTIITSTANPLPVKTPYAFINDNIFNPAMKNDDRILDACKHLELNDATRALDTPRRIFRKTVLLTNDRFLRVKASAVDIPSAAISSIIFWLTCHGFPEEFNALVDKSKEDRRKQYLKRKHNRNKNI